MLKGCSGEFISFLSFLTLTGLDKLHLQPLKKATKTILKNGFCHYNQSTLKAKLKSYTNVTSGDREALKMAIFKNGPVAVAIHVSHKSFSFYSRGVYYEQKCGNELKDLNHAVLAVGYGVLAGQPYWLIKNSWSIYWGNAGYILMSMEDNNCGVATDATYVTLE
ncbi:hypothetical protein scyTo_0016802 [Scyliorhinus torazame]|uniref:Peptidase C1A papain C-terminal domain-containing protein n=1 Tax=Scyliorhinus torazame TaxID=75743 RepID=A0A401PYN6_SCYTO|nr:hypothetical protein [Scyliorhinus torazame]